MPVITPRIDKEIFSPRSLLKKCLSFGTNPNKRLCSNKRKKGETDLFFNGY